MPTARTARRPRQERRTLIYKTVGSCAIHADLHRPEVDGRLPFVLWIHGGGLIGGSRRDLLPRHRNAYLSLGLSVLAIDYRLAPETLLPQIVGDVKDAYEWAATTGADELGPDPTRIALVGHSGGGYLASSSRRRWSLHRALSSRSRGTATFWVTGTRSRARITCVDRVSRSGLREKGSVTTR